MKILHVSINSFGKAQNVELDFGGGVNVMQNANSFGKTTLASFIRAMLYGLNYSYNKINDERINDVVRFCPWGQKGLFGGSMTVEHDNQVWRIERFFGSTAKQEELRVTNETTGKQADLGKEPGEFFLGLVADSYDRSTYYPQKDVTIEGNENLDGKLANLVDSADYDKINDNLQNYCRKKRAARGVGGTIAVLDQRIYDLNAQLNEALRKEDEYVRYSKELAEVSAQINALNEQKRRVESQLDEVKKQIVLSTPTDEQRLAEQRLTDAELKMASYPKSLNGDRTAAEQLAKRIAETPRHPNVQQPSSKSKVWLTVLAALLIVGGAALCFVGTISFLIIGGAVTLCGVILLVCSYVLASRKGNATETLQSTEWDELVTQYLRLVGRYVDVRDADYEVARDLFWKYCSDFDRDCEVLATLRKVTPTISHNGVDELKAKEKSLADETARLNDELTKRSRMAGSLETIVNGAKSVDKAAIEDKILQTSADKADEQLKFDTATKVIELLSQAKDNLSCGYLPKLRNRTTELLDYVTGGSFEVSSDRDFVLRIRENGKTSLIDMYSRGIREITMLCFRIALSELLYDGKVPLLIVDDAFVNFDEDNFLRATKLLADMAANGTQVIYFTCHNRLGALR